MANNSKSRSRHVFRQDIRQDSIRRRDGTMGVEYWGVPNSSGIVYRPMRRMTVEEAFPRLMRNDRSTSKQASFKPTTHVNGYNSENHKVAVPNKAKQSDFGTDAKLVRDNNRDLKTKVSAHYQYSTKIRYLENGGGGSLSVRPKTDKRRDWKSIDNPKQSKITIQEAIDYSKHKELSNSNSTGPSTNGHVDALPYYRIVAPTKEHLLQKNNKSSTAWSEMSHFVSNDSSSKVPGPSFEKIGLNHTFRIPRPKATISRNSVIPTNINLTASKKRAVRFGQDKVYEYTPLEPLNNYPIHEEIL